MLQQEFSLCFNVSVLGYGTGIWKWEVIRRSRWGHRGKGDSTKCRSIFNINGQKKSQCESHLAAIHLQRVLAQVFRFKQFEIDTIILNSKSTDQWFLFTAGNCTAHKRWPRENLIWGMRWMEQRFFLRTNPLVYNLRIGHYSLQRKWHIELSCIWAWKCPVWRK